MTRKKIETELKMLDLRDRLLEGDIREIREDLCKVSSVLLGLIGAKRLRFVNESPHPDPSYACDEDSGMDVRAWIREDEGELDGDAVKTVRTVTLRPHETRLFHTGIRLEIPDGCEVQVRPRSGLSAKKGVTVCNAPGTVDKGYRGEVCVLLLNTGEEDVVVCDGDRIAQMVLSSVYGADSVTLEKVGGISDETARGDGGFGHTGLA